MDHQDREVGCDDCLLSYRNEVLQRLFDCSKTVGEVNLGSLLLTDKTTVSESFAISQLSNDSARKRC
jgi:hypothetical protein